MTEQREAQQGGRDALGGPDPLHHGVLRDGAPRRCGGGGPSAPRAPERKAEPGNPGGGGTVLLGVAWYDRAFFDDRRDAWFGAMHQRIHKDPGIPLEDITVTHWQLLAS